jgi:polysaccharide deacetylase family protein (PEP-CTERM system associated)
VRKEILDALSVDVEDWHNATILQCTGKVFPPGEAVVRNSERLLEIFGESGAKATWFFLGEVAEAFPDLVRRVTGAGHEAGVHGFHHHAAGALGREAYRESIRRAKAAVEEASGREVIGYRAVDFSIGPETLWAFDVLHEAGFRYDSSLFPFAGPRYGSGKTPLGPHWITTPRGKRIYEIPVGVGTFLGLRLPACGGGYFRLFPFAYTRFLVRSIHRRGYGAVFYLHPAEIESPAPLAPLPEGLSAEEIRLIEQSHRSQVKNRRRVEPKVRALLSAYRFTTISEALGGIPQSIGQDAVS